MLYRLVSSVFIPLFAVIPFAGCGSTRPTASVAAPSNLMITTSSLPSGTVGSLYSSALNAQGGVSLIGGPSSPARCPRGCS